MYAWNVQLAPAARRFNCHGPQVGSAAGGIDWFLDLHPSRKIGSRDNFERNTLSPTATEEDDDDDNDG